MQSELVPLRWAGWQDERHWETDSRLEHFPESEEKIMKQYNNLITDIVVLFWEVLFRDIDYSHELFFDHSIVQPAAHCSQFLVRSWEVQLLLHQAASNALEPTATGFSYSWTWFGSYDSRGNSERRLNPKYFHISLERQKPPNSARPLFLMRESNHWRCACFHSVAFLNLVLVRLFISSLPYHKGARRKN